MGDQAGGMRHAFWDNIEQRPLDWISDWDTRQVSEPSTRAWMIAATGRVWSTDRRLVAAGGSTLLCRPAARRPDR